MILFIPMPNFQHICRKKDKPALYCRLYRDFGVDIVQDYMKARKLEVKINNFYRKSSG